MSKMDPAVLMSAADSGQALATLPDGPTMREIRKAAGLSQEVVAVAVGIGSKALWRYESGAIRPQSVAVELRLRRVLGAIQAHTDTGGAGVDSQG